MTKWGITLPRGANKPGWRADPRGMKTPIVGWKTTPDVANPPKVGVYRGRAGVVTNFRSVDQTFINTHMAALQARGITWIREAIVWDTVEHVQGTYDWTAFDRVFNSAATYGIDVLGVVCYSAAWAASGATTFYPPTNTADYATFCTRVAQRYGPTAGGRLRAMEIWNEPWLYTFWKPEVNPSAYAALAVPAAQAIRAADPSITILAVGDLYQSRADAQFGVAFQSSVISAQPTLPTLIDGWAVHAYASPLSTAPTDDTISNVLRFQRAELARDNARQSTGLSLPVWITEVGWTNSNTANGVSEAVGANYVRAALDRALQTWGDQVYRPRIDKVFIYGFILGDTSTASDEGCYGLIRTADQTYKPALDQIAVYT